MRVAICISTFHRPVGLERLLASLAGMELPASQPEIGIVVVNNDPDDTRPDEICRIANDAGPFEVTCLAEHRRGLSYPRNRALEFTVHDYDFIAYIDDDSVATPDWLRNLLDVQQSSEADAVAGPVAPMYEKAPPAWIVSGGFFARKSRPTGTRMPYAYTNNVLLSTSFVRDTGLRFEPAFALEGGEDTHFFRRWRKLGGSIVWADDAVVDDSVPEERATARWLVRRHVRTGMTTVRIERDLRGGGVVTLLLVVKSAVWLILGVGLFGLGVLAGRAVRVRARCWLGWGRGLARGVLGQTRCEYLEER